MTTAANQFVSLEQQGAVTTLWLERPARANALSPAMLRELTAVAARFHDDIATRVVIIAGRGKHFCAGADLRGDHTPTTPQDEEGQLLRRARNAAWGGQLIRALLDIPQLTIAAVQGAALGGGCCIAAACDVRVGADDAFCGYPEIDRGMNLQWRALPLCVRLIGPARAKRMLILGRHEPARLLFDWGFFDELVPLAQVHARAMTLAMEYASKPPLAAQMIKRSVDAVANFAGDAIMHMDHEQWLLTSLSRDYEEGIAAYRERRPARFTGD